MSEDLKKDILEATKNAQTGNAPNSQDTIVFPDPVVLKHSLNDQGVLFPPPVYRQDGKEKSDE